MSMNGLAVGALQTLTSNVIPSSKQLNFFEATTGPNETILSILPPISSITLSAASASSSSTSSSSCESGIVMRDSAFNVNSMPIDNPAVGGGSLISTENPTKILLNSNLNMAEATQKLNQQEQQPKTTQIPLPEDPRTLQLALELSLVGLNENQSCYVDPQGQHEYTLGSFGRPHHDPVINNLPFQTNSGLLIPSAGLEDRSKKSQNMTECVPVPSSEHVAEIVGRQGCKIKALRAKTNTYIKTPVRGEEPVFVVTGRKEDVNKAKREILSAADHFSLIRASRKPSMEGHTINTAVGGGNSNSAATTAGGRAQSGPPLLPGQITIQVRVPYRVVGLVVGPKGATIKHIQQETQTYIVTPSREKEPIFEVTGLPDNVQLARKQIEAHIALRTGSNQVAIAPSGEQANGGSHDSLNSFKFSTITHALPSFNEMLNDDMNHDILSTIYKSAPSPAVVDYVDVALKGIDSLEIGNSNNCTNIKCLTNSLDPINSTTSAAVVDKYFSMQVLSTKINQPPLCRSNSTAGNKLQSLSFCTTTSSSSNNNNHNTNQCITGSNILTRSCSSASSTASTKSTNNSANSTNSVSTPPELLNIWKSLNDSIDVDEGIGDSPSIWNLPTTLNTQTAHESPTESISPTDSLLGDHIRNSKNFNNVSTLQQQQLRSTSAQQLQQQQQKKNSADKQQQRECYVCNEKEVTTALVPCGHNLFCMDCANQICVTMEAVCPVCNSIVYHAMRILA